jgi:hypothetical protein
VTQPYLGQQFQTIHAGHVDIGKNRDQRRLELPGEAIQLREVKCSRLPSQVKTWAE